MALADIVQVTVSLQNGAVTQDGFGTPLIYGFTTAFSGNLVQTFNTASYAADMIAAGYLATDPIYKTAQAIASQTPAPSKFKVGRALVAATQRVKITPTVQASTPYSFKVKSPAGVVTQVSFTSAGSPTLATIAAQIIAAVPATVTASDQTTFTRVLANATNSFFSFYDFSANLNFAEDTPIAGAIATDLANIALEDNDWYALVPANKGSADALLASAWIESQKKIMAYATNDTDVASALTTDVGSQLKTGSRFRTIVIFGRDAQENSDAAFLGRLLPYAPGSESWKFKTLGGISATTLTATQVNNLIFKNVNYYQAIRGRNVTAEGRVAAGEWIDAIRLRDAIESRVSENVLSVFLAALKVPFSDAGIATIDAATRSALQGFIETNGLLSFTTSFPTAASISTVDKSNRRLTGCTFTAQLAGAIHFAAITGTLSV